MRHNQRSTYGNTLVELGRENEHIVVLEADLGKSTMSCLFEKEFPERYFEMGIAEQNMTGFAGGLSLAGKIPFVNSFAVFAAGRAYDQIRQGICTANLNVKIVGSSSGMSDFGDGATHQAIDDIALMRALPNMTVFTPCDATEVPLMLRAAIELEGPAYIRLCRNELEDIFPVHLPYKIGQAVTLRAGADFALVSHGIMAHKALEAAEQLKSLSIDAAVIHLPTVKPIDEGALYENLCGYKGVVVCEECNIRGGLTEYIAYILRNSEVKLESVSVADVFGQSAYSHEELLEYYHLSSDDIVGKVKRLRDMR